MPSTYTQSLRQELQASGENDSTWGDKLNQNFREVLEQAIAGIATVTMNNQDYTLYVAYGAEDEARNAILIVGGVLSQARNIIVPSVPKIYTVQNITSGGQSIIIKTATGQGVTVTNGEVGIMFCNGVNMVSSAAATADGSLIPSKITAGAAQWKMNGSFGVNVSIPVDANIGKAGVDGTTGSQFLFYVAGVLVATQKADANYYTLDSGKPIRFAIGGNNYVVINADGTVACAKALTAVGLNSTTSIVANTTMACGTTMTVGTHLTVGGTTTAAGAATYQSNMTIQGTTSMQAATCTTLSGTTLSASTNITLTSDERLKHKWLDYPSDLVQRLANVKAGSYALKSTGARGMRFVGIGAQSLEEAWTEAVDKSDPSELKVKMPFLTVAVVALSKKLVELEARLAEMESE